MTTELVYAFDPLCGWCYGFGGALRALRGARPDLRIALRMGGLVTGDRIGLYSAAAEYIRTASARLTAVTGAALDLRQETGDARPCLSLSRLMRFWPLPVPEFC